MAMDLSNRETAARAYELRDCYRAFVYYCKCFTYVTKTHANLTTYSVDSIKRTVHLAFHGLFSLLKILFTISKQYF